MIPGAFVAVLVRWRELANRSRLHCTHQTAPARALVLVDRLDDFCYTIGHMKKLLVALFALFMSVGVASAREGSVDLTGNGVSCKGVSLYQDGAYKVSGRCDGLVYPYETMYNKYVLWGKTVGRGEIVRIAEIDRGYFAGSIASAFEAMYVTAESDGLVRKMSDKQIVTGAVIPFSFDKSKVTTVPATTTTTSPAKTTTVQSGSTVTSTAGAVVGKIVSSLLVIILVVVVLAIGASLLFRNRGSVSA